MLASYLPRSAASARLLLNLAVERGLPAEECLRGTGLREDDLEMPGLEIQSYQEERLIENLVDAFGEDTDFALEAGKQYPLAVFGMLGFACMSARTLRETFEISIRYQDLAFTLAQARLVTKPDVTYIQLDASKLRTKVRRFAVEQCFATVWARITEMGGSPPPGRIEVTHRRPAAGDYFRSVLGSPGRYQARANRIGFPNSYLDRLRPQVDPAALALCEQQCRDMIERRRAQVGTAGFIRERLSRASGPIPSMALLASDLNMSVRTLRRALAREGTTFRALDEAVRRERGEALLTQTGQSIEEVAEAVGYATAAAYVRAFKRWHGVPPGRWRAGAPKTRQPIR